MIATPRIPASDHRVLRPVYGRRASGSVSQADTLPLSRGRAVPDPASPGTADEASAGASACLSTSLIDVAFRRDGSIWGTAGAEPLGVSEPADFIFGTAAEAPVPSRTGRPTAPVLTVHRVTSDTMDAIFTNGQVEAA